MYNHSFADNDPYLKPYSPIINERIQYAHQRMSEIGDLLDFACGHLYYGLTKEGSERVFREWAPNATSIYLIGDFNNWKPNLDYAFTRLNQYGNWELRVPIENLPHKTLYKLFITWNEGEGERIPAWTNRVVQDPNTMLFSAQIWDPTPYQWRTKNFEPTNGSPLIYEAHIGMATEEFRVGTYREFADNILNRIVDLGYNTVQLMAIQEHPYYGSFGYHVSSFFAVSSRFGTPEDFKYLVDKAHSLGLRVIMDLIHSHAVKNILEGLNLYAGDPGQFFRTDQYREHPAWDSLCFDYGKTEVIHFLLSNCKYWLEEYHIDGFRFDGITSMLYFHHGLNRDFTDYSMYFDGSEDKDAMAYLIMANQLIHQLRPNAITIAEEMSGMPGIATPFDIHGFGFDYRLAMGTPDYWIKLIKEVEDEYWNVGELYYELTRKRDDEKTIGYVESHDQALVGDQTIIFRLIGAKMYDNMGKNSFDLIVNRGIALHKLIRLITLATSGNGYLNFMGNEFGHPEWIDFPREGNNNSYQYARRQWHLANDPNLRYGDLLRFDQAMIGQIAKHKNFFQTKPQWVHDNKEAQIIAFMRDGLLFVFNFNPKESYFDYAIDVIPGKYKLILSSDAAVFGGMSRIDQKMLYYTASSEPDKTTKHTKLKLYIPSRCAIVLMLENTPNIRSLINTEY